MMIVQLQEQIQKEIDKTQKKHLRIKKHQLTWLKRPKLTGKSLQRSLHNLVSCLFKLFKKRNQLNSLLLLNLLSKLTHLPASHSKERYRKIQRLNVIQSSQRSRFNKNQQLIRRYLMYRRRRSQSFKKRLPSQRVLQLRSK